MIKSYGASYPAFKQGGLFFISLYKPVLEFRMSWGGPMTSTQVEFLAEQLGYELSVFNTFSPWEMNASIVKDGLYDLPKILLRSTLVTLRSIFF